MFEERGGFGDFAVAVADALDGGAFERCDRGAGAGRRGRHGRCEVREVWVWKCLGNIWNWVGAGNCFGGSAVVRWRIADDGCGCWRSIRAVGGVL